MGNFINERQFGKHLTTVGNSSLYYIGYDDFNYTKPLYVFRVQTIYTLHFVISGKGYLEIGGKSFYIKSGEMFFIPPDIEMRYFPIDDDPWEYVWFSFNMDIASIYGELLGFSLDNPVQEIKYFQRIQQILKKTLEKQIDDSCGYFGLLSSFYEIMEICTAYSPRTEIQKIKQILDQSYTFPDFNIEQLCLDTGISHAHLARLFKKEFGITVIKYVIKKRIELACELLLNSDISVKSVAFSCGFSDETHFMKTFKNQMGVTALSYRKTNKAI